MAYSDVFGAAKKKNSKPVCQYDFDGNFIKEYSSSYEAGKELGVMPYCIGYCCQGKIGSVKGFLWRYKNGEYTKKAHTRARIRRIVQMKIDGSIIKIWGSIKEASIGTSSNSSAICGCCNGRKKTTNGYKWKYYDKEPVVF